MLLQNHAHFAHDSTWKRLALKQAYLSVLLATDWLLAQRRVRSRPVGCVGVKAADFRAEFSLGVLVLSVACHDEVVVLRALGFVSGGRGDPAGFSLASSFGSTTLAPNASTTFTVQLNAITASSYSGILSFANNDTDENPFNFTISGSVSRTTAVKDWRVYQ